MIAIGDPGQLPSVQAGGWLRAVGERVGHHRLKEVRRQRDPEERRALGQLREGNSRPYLAWADGTGRVSVHDQAGPALDRAVGSWVAAVEDHGLRDAVLIARDNETRQLLNDRARQVRRDLGGLGEDHDYGPVTVAVGDRIICRRNDALVHVDNGTRGTVLSTRDDGITIRTDTSTERDLPARYVAEHVEPAYALTGHGMQGGTVEWTAVVGEPWDLTRGWSYTALSRARDTTELHVITTHDADDPDRDEIAPHYRPPRPTRAEVLEQVAQRMAIRDDEDLAVDRLGEVDERSRPAAPDAAAPTIEPPVTHTTSEVEPAEIGDRRRLAALLQEQARLKGQRGLFPIRDLRDYEEAADRIARLQAQRAALAERLDAVPEPRKRLFRAPTDEHAAERSTWHAAVASADRAIQEEEARKGDAASRLPGDPAMLRHDLDDLNRELRGITSRTERGLSALADQEVRREPEWATRQLGRRPDDYALRKHWDDAAREIAKCELRYRPLRPIVGLASERPGLGDEARDWARAAQAVRGARHSFERGQDPPDLEFDFGR